MATADHGAPVELVVVVVAQPEGTGREGPSGSISHLLIIGSQAVNMSRPMAAQISEAIAMPSGRMPMPKKPCTMSS